MSTTTIGFDAIRQAPRRICRTVWETIPSPVRQTPLMFRAGRYIYRKFTKNTQRIQTHYTHFMRNPPLLAVLAELASNYPENSNVKVASIGCSTGAELYSVLYAMRMARADLNIAAHGIDISSAVVAVAKSGIYRPDVPAAEPGPYGRAEVASEDVPQLADIFEPLPDGSLRVKDWLRQNTTWLTADATGDELLDLIGTQHFLLANNFMGPMEDRLAERCLRNMMRLVASGGYLVVDGVDLDVKTKVLKDSGFHPVLINQSEIWASEAAKRGWPWLRWAREPLDRDEPDWPWRYSVVFRFGDR
ncbi:MULTISPECIES: CheR family methyltransferase [unclassified Rhizobium]|uniref:CheR family methyltransferase n=1 Tax=unclassified Rhizobium TaxID=2613769 RepID=UPI000DDDDF18|nr:MULTISPECIES: CheR family methyltransferase [unclassified Rhizobium]MBB3286877.1 chemotaxis methyl-accepting protein methylase [Rhizobium sp. BK252]MBB3401617.1 chemotaxis methyl-accepting protein methylase [Rhizobium sp. BK289]MBB3414439.1 chemotaxis methyl-accepting protein methylase [Rhizobium sp. BK284]MBB3482327.1 chemotaxis methyl-accepting protein methylase [Rhizobium sp. BK347]MDK4718373.1 chemotaxis protein CheR [Rhizobium sp. CNPSo 3968]